MGYLQLEYEQLHACQLGRRQHQTHGCIADAELGLRNGVRIGVIVVLLALKYTSCIAGLTFRFLDTFLASVLDYLLAKVLSCRCARRRCSLLVTQGI